MIQVLDWLYENELRSYPFKMTATKVANSATYTVPNNLLLDAQFTFDTHPGSFSLTKITNTDNTDIVFEFSDTTTITVAKGISSPHYHRTSTGKLLVIGLALNDVPIGTHNFSALVFEPSTIYAFGGPWKGVSSLSFDNSSPTTGAFNFIDGYQMELTSSAKIIKVAIGNIYGTPVSCETFGDSPDDCSDIISTINGVSPDGNNELLLRAGNGFVVWDDPPNHRIYVGLAFTSIGDVCPTITPFPV